MSERFHRLELDNSRKLQSAQLARQMNVDAASELHDCAHWMRLAEGSRRRGQFEEALRDYSRAVEQDRAQVGGWVGQVRMLIALEEHPEAELWARKALELFRGQAELSAARAQALCRRGNLTDAQAACDAAIGAAGVSSYPWLVRGELLLARREPIADYCFDKAVQLDGDWIVLIEIAGVYKIYRRPAQSLSYCRRAVQQAPESAYCWFSQGESERALGLRQSASLSFQRCLDLEPKNPRAKVLLEQLKKRKWRLFGWFRS